MQLRLLCHCCRAARRSGEQLRQLDARLSAFSIASSAEWHFTPQFSALPAGLMLGVNCLHLLSDAQLAGQELYRLAAGLGDLTFGSGQRVLHHLVSSSADASKMYMQLQKQVEGMQCLLAALKFSARDTPACTSRDAIARTVLKPSALLPWMGAAAAALRHAHNQLENGGEWGRPGWVGCRSAN